MLMARFNRDEKSGTNWIHIDTGQNLVSLTSGKFGGDIVIYDLTLEDIATLRKALDEGEKTLRQEIDDKDCPLCGKPSPDGFPHQECVNREAYLASVCPKAGV